MPDLKFSFAIFLYRALNCVLNKLMRVDPSGFEYHSYMEILNNSFKNKFKYIQCDVARRCHLFVAVGPFVLKMAYYKIIRMPLRQQFLKYIFHYINVSQYKFNSKNKLIIKHSFQHSFRSHFLVKRCLRQTSSGSKSFLFSIRIEMQINCTSSWMSSSKQDVEYHEFSTLDQAACL